VQTRQCLDDQWEAVGEVIAGATVEFNSVAVLAGDDAKLMLDLVQPRATVGRLFSLRGQTGRDETDTQHGGVIEPACSLLTGGSATGLSATGAWRRAAAGDAAQTHYGSLGFQRCGLMRRWSRGLARSTKGQPH
jgi:hypothetical protein